MYSQIATDEESKSVSRGSKMWSWFTSIGEKRFWPALLLITGVGLVCRLAYNFIFQWHRYPPLLSDPTFYRADGAFLAGGNGFPSKLGRPEILSLAKYGGASHETTSTLLTRLANGQVIPLNSGQHPPLTAIVLAIADRLGVISYGSQLILIAIIGSATVLMIGLCARAAVDGRTGLMASLLAALYPIYWIESGQIMSEPISILLVSTALLLSIKLRKHPTWLLAFTLGLICGLDTLTRPEQIFMIVILLVVAFAWNSQINIRQRLALALFSTVVAMAIVSPWIYRNMTVYNQPEILSTASGLTLATTNCQQTYYGPLLGTWYIGCETTPAYLNEAPYDESDTDYYLRTKGIDYIKSHISRVPIVLAARLGRVVYVFQPAQEVQIHVIEYASSGSVEWAGIPYLWLLILFGIYGAVRMRRLRLFPLPMIAISSYMLAVCVFISPNPRLRAIGDVGLLVLASVGVIGLLDHRYKEILEPVKDRLIGPFSGSRNKEGFTQSN